MTFEELRALAEPAVNGSLRFPPPYWQMSPSLEECDLIYALVRATKPANVLELGTGYGVTARFIAEALKANGAGQLRTVESNQEYRDAAIPLLAGLEPWIAFAQTGDAFVEPDLVLIDSGLDRRKQDIVAWLGPNARLRPRLPLVLVHDANRNYDLQGAKGVLLATTDGLWVGRAA